MHKFNLLLASTGVFAIAAYQNTSGWKKDADGKLVVDADGNPIYVNASGGENSIKGDTIATLNSEAKNHRTAKEKAESDLAKYRDDGGKLIDPEVAKKAIDTVSKIDAKTLIDAGEVDRVREQIKAEFTTQLADKDKAIGELSNTNKTLLVDKAFDGSEFVASKIAVPRDMFRAYFGNNVKVGDNGNLEFYGRDGNRLLSKTNHGEFATGDEAFALMVEQHAQKDTILKAPDANGTGGQGGGGNRGTGATIKRTEFETLPPHKQAEIATKGEVQIVD